MITLFPHAATTNHGCEAIIMSMTSLLNEEGVNYSDIELIHHDTKNDDYTSIEEFCNIVSFQKEKIRRGTLLWFKTAVKNRISLCKYQTSFEKFRSFMAKREKPDMMISIGGDNYCYGVPYMLYAIDKWASEYGSKLVLWGCSIENNCSSEMLSDLSRFDLIIARESLTADYLRSKLRTRILCMPDPAFTLPPDSDESYCLPENTVGINISPMVMNYELDNGIAFKNYAVLVQYILQNTSYHVALIPHVTAPLSNDMIPLKKILDKFKEFRDRVTLVQDGNCKKLKYAISQCRFFIGARTHATIAAYSSCVPTIVLGYSVKSRGIARDLFGEEKNYVLPVQNLKTEKDLINAFCRMERDENLIRKRLEEIMPTYIGQAKNAVKEVMKILG